MTRRFGTIVTVLLLCVLDPMAEASCEPLPGLDCVDTVVHRAPTTIGPPQTDRPVVLDAFGTAIARATPETAIGGAKLSAPPRHRYARRQAWNADESLIDLGSTIVAADTYRATYAEPPISSARSWSNLDRTTLYGIRANPDPNDFGRYDLDTGVFTSIVRFDRFERCSIGEGEGNLSNDDRYVVLVCAGADDRRVLIAYDLVADRELGRRRAAGHLNWASFTQSGHHVVVENHLEGSGEPSEILRYDPTLETATVLDSERAHGDLGVDALGRDVLVMMRWDRLWYLDIASGERVVLDVGDRDRVVGHGHVSCRNIRRPGWCYLSSYEGAIGAVELTRPAPEANGVLGLWTRVTSGGWRTAAKAHYEPWGVHGSSSKSYRVQPQASASPSGRALIFSSDWRGDDGAAEYVIRPLPGLAGAGRRVD